MLLEEMVSELCSDVRVSETVALASGEEMSFILLICMCKMPWKRRKAETLAVTSASVWSAAGVTNGLVCVCVAWWLLSLCGSQRWHRSRAPRTRRWAGAGLCVPGFVPVPRRLGGIQCALRRGGGWRTLLGWAFLALHMEITIPAVIAWKIKGQLESKLAFGRDKVFVFLTKFKLLVGNYMVWQLSSVPKNVMHIVFVYWLWIVYLLI